MAVRQGCTCIQGLASFASDTLRGVLQMSGLDDRDIVFVRYVNEAKDNCCLPYLIAVDKTTTSVGECCFLCVSAMAFCWLLTA